MRFVINVPDTDENKHNVLMRFFSLLLLIAGRSTPRLPSPQKHDHQRKVPPYLMVPMLVP